MAWIRGWAVVARAQPLRPDPESAITRYRLTLEVHRDGVEPYPVTRNVTVRRGLPVGQGSVLAVDISARNPEKVKVDWHRTATEPHPDRLRGRGSGTPRRGTDVESTLHRMLNGSGGDGPLMPPGARRRSEDPHRADRIDQLERLAALKESGALSDEEFEAEKRRLLDD